MRENASSLNYSIALSGRVYYTIEVLGSTEICRTVFAWKNNTNTVILYSHAIMYANKTLKLYIPNIKLLSNILVYLGSSIGF